MTAPLTTEAANAVKRAPVRVGGRRVFYSTMLGESEGVLLRAYTGQEVTVIESVPQDPETEKMFRVRADDGTTFPAYRGELNGWYRDTGQYANPDGTWGPRREVLA